MIIYSDIEQILHFILGIFVSTLFILTYKFRYELAKKISSQRLKNLFFKVFDLCKIHYNNMFSSIFLPITLVLCLWAYAFFYTTYTKSKVSMIYVIESTIITPFWEEIFMRGLLLGLTVMFFYYIATRKLKWKENKVTYFAICVWSVFLISVVFSLWHNLKIDRRYISGLIYGTVYLIDKKNLLPAMIGHSVNNIFTILVYGCINC